MRQRSRDPREQVPVIASPRILIPILVNHQNADGTVTVPGVLRKYVGGMERIEARK